jgi:hypothetical protein
MGVLPDSAFVRLNYLIARRQILHVNPPNTFSEKLQWLKLHGNLQTYHAYADKWEVRDYVKGRVGASYLVPLFAVWDDYREVDVSKLPEQFVLKASHGSGFVFVCRDKACCSQRELQSMLRAWMSIDFYRTTRELQYKACQRRVLCEALLDDGSGDMPDYKFFCFHGTPELVQVDTNRFANHRRDLFSTDWKRLPVELLYPNADQVPPTPAAFDEMLEVSRCLSRGFDFVRVDLYSSGGRVYFGELTFTPGNGLEQFDPPVFDLILGNKLHLGRPG